MNETIFVIGGCRSGKSRYALETADNFPGHKRVFIATCIPNDEEMKQRVVQHQKERSRNWDTVEAPTLLPDAIVEHSRQAQVLLIDCLTLWISNLLAESEDAAHIPEQIPNLIQAIQAANCPVVLVSNEVGAGIVPENRLARLFRDLIGCANQAVANQAGKVVWMVAGIPVTIKG
ncbi:MAG: bifunctional adenosylcobinamide kinase/adenosylcobinamide-phosphate guanylyltransferase [Deltaproteobacteria bacterium]|nr:bifunctional adenosylcobinamide kinase/adenosylcobinamide-phosphate guanylyltransferase [Deltaproteobacteria bacterium]